MIKGISAQLPERYKLKIGSKGESKKARSGRTYRVPKKWEFMRICNVERDENGDYQVDEGLTKELGDGSLQPKVIGPVMLVYNDPDLNLYTAYRYYQGRSCICRGNGAIATRVTKEGKEKQVECPCEFLENGPCKPNGILSFIFPTAPLGGVCKFRTTSYNSIKTLYGGMTYFRQLTGGRLLGIPFNLRLNSKESQIQGKPQTVYFLSLEFDGKVDDLRQTALDFGREHKEQMDQVEQLEVDANKRKAIETRMMPPTDDDPDAEEFNPQYSEKEDGAIVDTTTGEMEEAPEVEERKPRFPVNGGENGKQAKGSEDGPEETLEATETEDNEAGEEPEKEEGLLI